MRLCFLSFTLWQSPRVLELHLTTLPISFPLEALLFERLPRRLPCLILVVMKVKNFRAMK